MTNEKEVNEVVDIILDVILEDESIDSLDSDLVKEAARKIIDYVKGSN